MLMKKLERKFFRYCCKNLIHDSINYPNDTTIDFREGQNLYTLILDFSIRTKCSEKQLSGYVKKWYKLSMIQLLDGAVNPITGKFIFDTFNHVIDDYIDIIPPRIKRHNLQLYNQIMEYNIFRTYNESVKQLYSTEYLKTVIKKLRMDGYIVHNDERIRA